LDRFVKWRLYPFGREYLHQGFAFFHGIIIIRPSMPQRRWCSLMTWRNVFGFFGFSFNCIVRCFNLRTATTRSCDLKPVFIF
jgi:hypothetical protein